MLCTHEISLGKLYFFQMVTKSCEITNSQDSFVTELIMQSHERWDLRENNNVSDFISKKVDWLVGQQRKFIWEEWKINTCVHLVQFKKKLNYDPAQILRGLRTIRPKLLNRTHGSNCCN